MGTEARPAPTRDRRRSAAPRAQHRAGLRRVGEHGVDSRDRTGDRRHAVRAQTPAEQRERSGGGTELAHAGAVAGEQSADAVRTRVIGAAKHRHVLERASRYGRLEHQRHDEVGVVDVPAEFVAFAVEHDVERADRVGLAVDRLDPECGPDEAREQVRLVHRAQRRIARDLVVGEKRLGGAHLDAQRVVGDEVGFAAGELEVVRRLGAEGERLQALHAAHGGGDDVRAQEPLKLARAEAAELLPTAADERASLIARSGTPAVVRSRRCSLRPQGCLCPRAERTRPGVVRALRRSLPPAQAPLRDEPFPTSTLATAATASDGAARRARVPRRPGGGSPSADPSARSTARGRHRRPWRAGRARSRPGRHT